MKKQTLLIILIGLWCSFALFLVDCKGQQNGTFKNAYVDTLRPIYPTTLGLNIKNKYSPLKISVNDTAMWAYIQYWSKKGGGSVDTSKLVTKYDITNGLRSPNGSGVLRWDDQNFFVNSVANIGNSNSLITADSSGFVYIKAIDNNSNQQGITFVSSGLVYDTHITNQNPLWIPDKNYVDSANYFWLEYDGDPLNNDLAVNVKNHLPLFFKSVNHANTLTSTIRNDSTMFEAKFESSTNGRANVSMNNISNSPVAVIGAVKGAVNQSIRIDQNLARYNSHKTSSDARWITDKTYVDSMAYFRYYTSGGSVDLTNATVDTILSINVPKAGKYFITFNMTLNANNLSVLAGSVIANVYTKLGNTNIISDNILYEALTTRNYTLGKLSQMVTYTTISDNDRISIITNHTTNPSVGTFHIYGSSLTITPSN